MVCRRALPELRWMVSGPHLGDDTGALLQDLVMCGAGIGVPGSAAPAPGSSSAAGPGVSGLLLSGSPSFPPPPIDWRRVGDEAKFPCSQVIVVDRLLHETLASIDRNILRPIWVSVKKERKFCLCASHFFHSLSSPPMFCFCISCPGVAQTCLRCRQR
jgi:hypothetical protein